MYTHVPSPTVPRIYFQLMLSLALLALVIWMGSTPCLGPDGPQGGAAFAASYNSVRIHTYNNWSFDNTEGWTFNQALKVLARKSNVVLTERFPSGVTPSALKAISPKIKVYMYYSLLSKSNYDTDSSTKYPSGCLTVPLLRSEINAYNWWLRDNNGAIIKAGEDSYYLDVGKPNFKEVYLQRLLSRLAGKGFDGVVLDYWHPKMVQDTQGRITNYYATDTDWYTRAWQPFVSYVCSGLQAAGYRVIGNCAGEYGVNSAIYAWQRSQLDGTVYEQGAVNWRSTGGAWLPGATIERRLNSLRYDPLEIWFANNGVRPDVPEYKEKILVSLAMYYIGIPPDQSTRSYDYAGDWNLFWDSLWDFRIGKPAAEAVRPGSQYFWVRRYTEGIVLLNYDVTTAYYTLPSTYNDVAGVTYSGQVAVPPHRALILQGGTTIIEPTPTPTPTPEPTPTPTPTPTPSPLPMPTPGIEGWWNS